MSKGCAFYGLREAVYETLKHAIMQGEYAPGDRLVELDIARRMNTSQGPVREALMQLEKEGMVIRHQRRATFVSPLPRPDTLSELYELRGEIEEMAVKRVIERAAQEELEPLQAGVNEMMLLARNGDLPRFFDADMAFHDHVFQISKHEILQRVWAVLVIQVRRLLPLTRHVYAQRLPEIAAEHQPLVDAIQSRDFDRWLVLWRSRHMPYVWGEIVGQPALKAVDRQAGS
jgi:DNA-binding GntR family transcriptional regulator